MLKKLLSVCLCSIPLFCAAPSFVPRTELGTDELKSLATSMIEKGLADSSCLFVAASSLGSDKHVLAIDFVGPYSTTRQFKVFVNPQIIWRSKEKVDESLSERIKICAYSVQGELIVEELTGENALRFQKALIK